MVWDFFKMIPNASVDLWDAITSICLCQYVPIESFAHLVQFVLLGWTQPFVKSAAATAISQFVLLRFLGHQINALQRH
jgi:hypothetical protein